MTEFKPGDTVALKSGGTAMTCIGHDDIGQALCVWNDERCEHNCQAIPETALTPIIRRAIHIDDTTIRHVWVFADSGQPIADHIAMRIDIESLK